MQQRLIHDGEFFARSKDVLTRHSTYRRKWARESEAPSATLGKGVAGMHAINAVERLIEQAAPRAEDMYRLLATEVSPGVFRMARGNHRSQFDTGSQPLWNLDKVRYETDAPQCPKDARELMSAMHAAAEEYRKAIRETAGIARKLKDQRRNAARDRLAARLCGLNHALLATMNTKHANDFSITATVALHGLAQPSTKPGG